MTVGHHPLPPAPRPGGVDPAPVRPDAVRRAADALVDAVTGPTGRPATVPACDAATGCNRPGNLTVVFADDTTRLCEMHAMTAVFATPGRVTLVKPV